MLNKIKIIGKVLFDKKQNEKKERNINDIASVFQETVNEIGESQFNSELKRGSRLYFSLLVPTPSNLITPLRCVALEEIAERIEKELQTEDIIEIRGYLRNEKEGLQIITKVVEFSKVNLDFEKIDKFNSNQVRLLGKIIDDFRSQKNKRGQEFLSFRLAVPRERVKFPLFFCRVNEEKLIPDFKEKLKRGDIILLEGFLQTKQLKEEEIGEKDKERPPRISSIICQGFTLLDNDSVNIFSPLDNLTRILKKVEEIDFSKKLEPQTDEEI